MSCRLHKLQTPSTHAGGCWVLPGGIHRMPLCVGKCWGFALVWKQSPRGCGWVVGGDESATTAHPLIRGAGRRADWLGVAARPHF
jgi:hypothetical protein